MLMLGLFLFALVWVCLMQRRSHERRDMECMQELNRLEYHHVYPVSE